MLCLVYEKSSSGTLILFCNLRIWEHIFENGPHLSATAIGKLFSKIGHENSCPGSFKRMFYGTKVVVAVTKICFYMFYMLLYINFTREKKNPLINSLVESLKPSLDICYTIWNQIVYYMQQLC